MLPAAGGMSSAASPSALRVPRPRPEPRQEAQEQGQASGTKRTAKELGETNDILKT